MTDTPPGHDGFDALLEDSSLGSAGAKRLRARTSVEAAQRAVRIAKLNDLLAHADPREKEKVEAIREALHRLYVAASRAQQETVPREDPPAAGPPEDDTAFLTVAEAAARLRVSKMTVYRLVHSGELTAVRVGRAFRIPYRAITELEETSADAGAGR